MRVSLVNTAEHGGGAESCARLLRDGMIARKHEAVLWVGRKPVVGPHTKLIPAEPGDELTASRYAAKGLFGLGLTASQRFVKSDALTGVDVVHLHNVHGHYFSLDAVSGLAQRAPLVWTLHDYFAITGGCAFPFSCDRWSASCGSCPELGRYPIATQIDRTRSMLAIKRKIFRELPVTLVTPSRHLARAVRASGMFDRAKLEIIPYGVDTDVFRPGREASRHAMGIAKDATVVTVIAQGLDDPRKGIRHAVDAIGSLQEKRITVLLAGGGDTREIVESLVGHDVRSLGYVSDRTMLARCLSAADLCLFTSLAENFPCIVQESMACGTAVLAFNIDGVNEQIQSERTGYLVPPGDTDALARHLQPLIQNRSRLRETGEAARRHAQNEWSVEQFLDRHEALYRRVQHHGCTENVPGRITSRIPC